MRALFFIILISVLTTCGMNTRTQALEKDDQGNVIAWWINVTIKAGHPVGKVWFTQTDENGDLLPGVTTTIGSGESTSYLGSDITFAVRINNKDACVEPCGFLRVYMCPLAQPLCDSEHPETELGVKPITGWEMSY